MENNVIFMGNLRNDQHKSELIHLIQYLFNHCLNFEYIKYKDIEVKGKSKKCKHAFITLRSEDDYNEAYYKLTSFESRMQLGFNFLELFDPSKQLNVNRKKTPKIMKNSPLKSTNSQPVITGEEKKNIPANNEITQPVVCADERKKSPPKTRNRPPDVSVDFQPKKQDNDSVKQKQTFYREGELLGNETRDKEFKKGGGEFVSNELKGCVSKYMSGFLNSSQQGTLFIGVKDDGSVVGIDCDRKKEDGIRICIDQVIKTTTPAIFPDNYNVEFIPVYKDGKAKANCKVLEIAVNILDLGTPEQLYEVSGEVYMRLDGTIERLKPSKIQEWTKQANQKELKRQLHVIELEAKKKSEVHQEELKRQQLELELELEAKKKSEVHQKELKRQLHVLELEAKKKSEVHQEELKRQQLELELELEAKKKSEDHQKELKRQLHVLELEAKKKSEVHQKELKRQLHVLELEAKKKSEVHQEELKRQQLELELELEAKKKSEDHQKELKRQLHVLELEAKKKSEVHQEELKRQQLDLELELEAKNKSEVHQKELEKQLDVLELEAKKKSEVCVLM